MSHAEPQRPQRKTFKVSERTISRAEDAENDRPHVSTRTRNVSRRDAEDAEKSVPDVSGKNQEPGVSHAEPQRPQRKTFNVSERTIPRAEAERRPSPNKSDKNPKCLTQSRRDRREKRPGCFGQEPSARNVSRRAAETAEKYFLLFRIKTIAALREAVPRPFLPKIGELFFSAVSASLREHVLSEHSGVVLLCGLCVSA